MEYVITPAVVGRDGFLSHDIVFDLRSRRVRNSPVLWWAVYYILFVGSTSWHRDHHGSPL
jgi:hypothetical protein